MSPNQLTDALSVSFFGLLGLWAAVVRRHWFLRFAIIAGFLLLGMLIPAHEVVIEFGIQIAVIAIGVTVARRRGDWKLRISIESALLAMVVVAVGAAVLARTPDSGFAGWLWMLRVGIGTGLLGLVCLWAVCGQVRWHWRLLGGGVGVAAFIVLFQFGDAVQAAIYQSQNGAPWIDSIRKYYTGAAAVQWFSWNLPSIAAGLAILLSMLALGRASGWFSAHDARREQSRGWIAWGARLGLCVIFLAVATPLFYLLYRLQSPTDFPRVPLPVPNGHDDLLAAGALVPATTWPLVQATSPTAAQIEAEMKPVGPALEHIAAGLRLPTYVYRERRATRGRQGIDDYALIRAAEGALMLRSLHAAKVGTIEEQIDASIDLLEFSQDAFRGGGLDGYTFNTLPLTWGTDDLLTLLPKMDAGQCRRTALRVAKLADAREPLEDCVQIQRAIDEREHWATHLTLILSEWSAEGVYAWQQNSYRRMTLEIHGLVARMAIRAHRLEHGVSPTNLAALSPDYLPDVPLDAYGAGPLKYQRDGDLIVLYSVGPDGDDDGGTPFPINAAGGINDSQGDLVWTVTPAELGLE